MPSKMNRTTQMGTSIRDLPTDAIVGIFGQLRDQQDRLHFARTCKFINQCRYTYHWQSMTMDFEASRNYPPHCASWCSSVLRRIKIDQWHSRVKCSGREGPSPAYTCKSDSHIDCAQCRACALERTFGHADDFLSRYKDMLSKRSFELSFTGSFGEANDRRYPGGLTIADEYRIQRALNNRGWSAIEINSFQFNMYWKFWNVMILSSISQAHLVTLKIPFPRYLELQALVRALSAMIRLRSLVITDIPDKPDFPHYAPMLGQGIRSREASLRELDLEMTNFNRPNPYAEEWERDEIFPRRKSLDWFFDNLFLNPEDLDEWHNNQIPYRSRASECEEYALCPTYGQGLLKLEKLRLKNINVPAYASQKIFDWAYLKELRLPHGRVDDAIWEDLKVAKLEVLEDIDYTELTHSLIRLLQSQSFLRSVTFARPRPLYSEGGMVDWEDGNGPQMTFGLAEWPSPLGPGTDWGRSGIWRRQTHQTPFESDHELGYPDITALLVALGKNKSLENLVLPVDMFDITPAVIRMASRRLKSLTHLTWGFDYNDQACRTAFTHSFLPGMPQLRRITFQSLSRRCIDDGVKFPDFDAEKLIRYIKPLGDQISPTLRYMRYLPLPNERRRYGGTGERTYVYYHRQKPVFGKWWIQLVDRKGNRMYEEDRTPCIYPPRNPGHLARGCSR